MPKDEEDLEHEYRETMQELMLALKIQTENVLKKLREESKKNRVKI